MNYANPNEMDSWAANHYGKVRTVCRLGFCLRNENGKNVGLG